MVDPIPMMYIKYATAIEQEPIVDKPKIIAFHIIFLWMWMLQIKKKLCFYHYGR